MRFGSVCSGIEAASVAFSPLGWKASWLSEIEPFPSAVLTHHYPHIPNLGDMTGIARAVLAGEVDAPDMLCGGTPCQAFSIAGLRESLDDARGNLTLKFVELADAIDHVRTRRGESECIVFWENVPGVLSTKDNAFGCFLAGLAGEDEPLQPPGKKWTNAGAVYGPRRAIAWRTLDAQYFGLAQRRRRVFVVASARDGFDPAAVLFEWDGVRRDSAPSRQARQVAPTIPSRSSAGGGLGTDFDCDGGLIPATSQCLTTGTGQRYDPETETILPVTHTLRAEGFDASEDGTGRGTPLVPVAFAIQAGALRTNPMSGPDGMGVQADHAYTLEARSEVQAVCFDTAQITSAVNRSNPKPGDPCHPLAAGAHPPAIAFDCKASGQAGFGIGEIASAMRAMGHAGSHQNGGGHQAVAVALRGREGGATAELGDEAQHCLRASGGGGDKPHVLAAMQVRRLTPMECERLQGFPDNYTRIPNWGGWRAMDVGETPEQCIAEGLSVRQNKKTGKWRVKDVDGPRYKALGNSWAVPCAQWIGQRIQRAIERLP